MVERMGYEITPSTYKLTCWGDVFRVDFYTITHIFKKRGRVINAALFVYVLHSIK